ncbi:cytochrome P450 monooxygenase-like protein [Stemphylium lycopersici]|nr:cytochrome P450 monooxygenase-like protein [Stemphylium lycopersici]
MAKCKNPLDVGVDEEPLIGDLKAHGLLITIAVACSLVAVTLSLYLVYRHLTNYTQPKLQKLTIRIVLMVPVYSICCTLSIPFYKESIYLGAIYEFYESIVIASFFLLLCRYIHTDLQSVRQLFALVEPQPWVFPVRIFRKYVLRRKTDNTPDGAKWFSFCVVKLGGAIAKCVTEALDVYCKKSNSASHARIWFTFSQLTSDGGAMSPTSKISYPSLSVGIPKTVLCFEMALVSILHLYAYPYDVFQKYKAFSDEENIVHDTEWNDPGNHHMGIPLQDDQIAAPCSKLAKTTDHLHSPIHGLGWALRLPKRLGALRETHRRRNNFHAHVTGFEPFGALEHKNRILQTVIKKQLTKYLNTVTEPLSKEPTVAIDVIFGNEHGLHRLRFHNGFENDGSSLDTEAARPLVFQGRKDGSAILAPMVEKRKKIKAEAREKGELVPEFNEMFEWLEYESKGTKFNPVGYQMVLSFAAIHTTSDLLGQTMMHLADEPQSIAALREEIVRVLSTDGLTKAALANLKLVDSALKEIQRVKPGSFLAMRRLAKQKVVLPDGTVIHKGDQVAVDGFNMIDPEIYPEPEKYDTYRYYRMRKDPATANKAHLVSTGPDNLTFGHGSQSCPGRFFSANEMKIAL